MNTLMIKKLFVGTAVVALGVLGSACGDDDDNNTAGMGASGGTGGTGGSGGTGGTGGSGATGGTGGDSGSGATGGTGGTGGSGATGGTGGGDPCDPSTNEVDVDANITADTTWECGTYTLGQITFVTNGATLTIEPGVRVVGDVDAVGTTALIVARGAKIDAVGTAAEPIVFTSGADEGDRLPADWGGVVLLGSARINTGNCVGGTGDACTGGYFETVIEGLNPTDPNSLYGGTDDAHDCGHLEYARIEFAGYELSPGVELNGLTTGGCGSATKLSYIQSHRGSDDGVEMFGGTASLDHLVITGASDDSLDWDLGWTGKVQFLVVHQLGNDGDKGFETDNNGADEVATPRSNPTLYNVTMIGNPTKTGILMREGTLGTLRNFLIQDFAVAVDLQATQFDLADEWPANISIEHSCFHNNGVVGDADSTDDDMGFNENDAILDAARNNVTNVDPMLGSTDITDPDYMPASTMLGGKATPPAGMDVTATYCGAFAQGGTDWTAGWTAFPAD